MSEKNVAITRLGISPGAVHRSRGPSLALIGLCWLALMVGGRTAWAQYLDSPSRDGYLDGSQAQPVPPDEFYLEPPQPLVRFGGALYLGAGYTDYGGLDEAFFTPNQAKEFEDFLAVALDGAFWFQFGRNVRLGIQGENLISGSGAIFTHCGSVGLLVEAGGPLSQGWSAWGGGVLGYTNLYAESKDSQSRWLEYSADSLHLRLQASIERQVLPFMSVRGTLFYLFNNLLNEDFSTQSATATVPFETDFDQHVLGLLVGILFHT